MLGFDARILQPSPYTDCASQGLLHLHRAANVKCQCHIHSGVQLSRY